MTIRFNCLYLRCYPWFDRRDDAKANDGRLLFYAQPILCSVSLTDKLLTSWLGVANLYYSALSSRNLVSDALARLPALSKDRNG